jgi:hypothetical protein
MSALLLIYSFFLSAFFQLPTDSGKVEIIQDAKIAAFVTKHVKINEKNGGKTEGYRVQIHFGTDRSKARDIKAKFLLKYQEIGAYEIYEQPNFKIRTGDFRTRLEAYKFLKEISADFPGSFIVHDNIELPKIQ